MKKIYPFMIVLGGIAMTFVFKDHVSENKIFPLKGQSISQKHKNKNIASKNVDKKITPTPTSTHPLLEDFPVNLNIAGSPQDLPSEEIERLSDAISLFFRKQNVFKNLNAEAYSEADRAKIAELLSYQARLVGEMVERDFAKIKQEADQILGQRG